MVLFAKNATTKSYISMYRAFSTTKANNFAQLIKPLPRPLPKVSHPEHAKSVTLWRNLSFFAAIPAIALVNLNIQFFEDHHPKRPDFTPYEYMRKRAKRFPWGDGNHSIFHNPHYNALPDGYETPDDEEEGHH